MKQIICPVCNNPNPFDLPENRPVECSFCFTPFEASVPEEEIEVDNNRKLSGLKLICQENCESILVSGTYCLLGREHTGARILSDIMVNGVPVISRKHCSISFTDGKFMIKDEGSSNGTYYGVNKIDCSAAPQVIENNSLIFLGREAFLVQFVFEDWIEPMSETKKTQDESQNKVKKYRCNEGCGFESETYYEICPNCYTSHSLIEIG